MSCVARGRMATCVFEERDLETSAIWKHTRGKYEKIDSYLKNIYRRKRSKNKRKERQKF